jgi:hypothetical protein
VQQGHLGKEMLAVLDLFLCFVPGAVVAELVP